MYFFLIYINTGFNIIIIWDMHKVFQQSCFVVDYISTFVLVLVLNLI